MQQCHNFCITVNKDLMDMFLFVCSSIGLLGVGSHGFWEVIPNQGFLSENLNCLEV